MFGLLDPLIFPSPKPSYRDDEAPWKEEDVIWLRPDRGTYQFPCVVVEPRGVEPIRVILYCHGNACDVGEVFPSFQQCVGAVRGRRCTTALLTLTLQGGDPLARARGAYRVPGLRH